MRGYPKAAGKVKNCSLPQILPYSSAKGQNTKNQEKLQDGDTAAKDQEKEHKRASLKDRRQDEAEPQASRGALRHQSSSQGL